jgi:hypothetical protein
MKSKPSPRKEVKITTIKTKPVPKSLEMEKAKQGKAYISGADKMPYASMKRDVKVDKARKEIFGAYDLQNRDKMRPMREHANAAGGKFPDKQSNQEALKERLKTPIKAKVFGKKKK